MNKLFPLLLCASPALADPVHEWGGALPSSVTISEAQDGYLVTYQNRLVSSLTVERFAVDLDGIVATGAVDAGNYMIPDVMMVTPPPGWDCSPCSVTVEENAAGSVLLFPRLLG